MSYFRKFPTYAYDIEDTNTYTLITDIMRRVNLKGNAKANTLVFQEYYVRDGEQPDIVAAKYYDDPEMHWVIVTINNITSRYDWPLDQVALSQYVNDKYSNPDGIHHYEISQDSGDTSIVIDIGTDNTDYPTATPITNREYEESEQDRKRKIRLLDPRYLDNFVEEFTTLIKQEIF